MTQVLVRIPKTQEHGVESDREDGNGEENRVEHRRRVTISSQRRETVERRRNTITCPLHREQKQRRIQQGGHKQKEEESSRDARRRAKDSRRRRGAEGGNHNQADLEGKQPKSKKREEGMQHGDALGNILILGVGIKEQWE